MIRLAVTVWFAVAAVLGPGLCCCLKAAEPAKKKSARSCCPVPDDTPAKSDRCPCSARAAVDPAPVERVTVDPVVVAFAFVGVAPSQWTVPSHIEPVPVDPPALSGRERLALYHVLTC